MLKIEKYRMSYQVSHFIKRSAISFVGGIKKHILTLSKNNKVHFKEAYLKRVNFYCLTLTMTLP